eukprot:TRINITY_DN2450_c0_g1_i1.p1 TRINITY_DN2450_c0_g1~~TRINITY_DN2450_c0_g1_i1.p1  ORF type:complete len:436 (-),score=25.20 TRINITY_DN2450_c0_g1_i1:499-1683(-)
MADGRDRRSSPSGHPDPEPQHVAEAHSSNSDTSDVGASNAPSLYLVDNSQLCSGSFALAFRLSKNLEDKDAVGTGAVWGSTVLGVTDGDNWLEVGDRYLPMSLQGVSVLTPLPEADNQATSAALQASEEAASSRSTSVRVVMVEMTEEEMGQMRTNVASAMERTWAQLVELARQDDSELVRREKSRLDYTMRLLVYQNQIISPGTSPQESLARMQEKQVQWRCRVQAAQSALQRVEEGECAGQCAICLGDLTGEGAEKVSKLVGCGHAFHDTCLRPWLRKSGTCPTCRWDATKAVATRSPLAPTCEPRGQAAMEFGRTATLGSHDASAPGFPDHPRMNPSVPSEQVPERSGSNSTTWRQEHVHVQQEQARWQRSREGGGYGPMRNRRANWRAGR